MKIVSLNKNPERYGFLSEMEYRNPDFHGHQTALCIGRKNTDGSWDKVYTSGDTEEEKIKIANDILNDKSLIILEDKIFENDNGNLVPKIIYYLPYYVADHSAYQPTINFEQIYHSCNVSSNAKIEVLFVHEEGWYNRYVTFDLHTSYSLSLIDFIKNLEQEIIGIAQKGEKGNGFFIAKDESGNYFENDIVLDFYDNTGQQYYLGFKEPKDLLKLVSSIRIIDIDTVKIQE
jgi:hypothetical protein